MELKTLNSWKNHGEEGTLKNLHLTKKNGLNSADLGVSLDYEVSENFTIDGQILNGEGYKKTQDADGLMRVGFGGTYKLSNFSIRLFRDIKDT